MHGLGFDANDTDAAGERIMGRVLGLQPEAVFKRPDKIEIVTKRASRGEEAEFAAPVTRKSVRVESRPDGGSMGDVHGEHSRDSGRIA